MSPKTFRHNTSEHPETLERFILALSIWLSAPALGDLLCICLGPSLPGTGDYMLMFEGQLLGDRGTCRILALLTGACWSEYTRLRFEVLAHSSSATLPMPFRCELDTRKNRVSEDFECLAHQTSDELVSDLARGFADVYAYALEHKVADLDGSLLWSEVVGAESLGFLWRPGMKQPVLGRPAGPSQKAIATANRIMTGDLFSAPMPKRSSTSRTTRQAGPGRQPTRRAGQERGEGAHGEEPAGADALPPLGDGGPLPAEDPSLAASSRPRAPLAAEEMDVADAELNSLDGSDLEELECTYMFDQAARGDSVEAGEGNEVAVVVAEPEVSHEDGVAFAEAMEDAGVAGHAASDEPEDPAGAAAGATRVPPEPSSAALPP